MENDEETESKKEGKATGKWASEAYELFRLFSRTGRTFYGLIVLLLGWILLILLLGRLPAEPDTPPQIAIPWLQSAWRVTSYSIPVQKLFVPGAILLCLWWCIYSGFAAYIFWPLRTLLRSVAARTTYYGGVFLYLLAELLLAPFEFFWVNRWIRRLSPDEREKLLRDKIDQNKLGREAASQILEAFRNGKGRKIWWLERTYGKDLVAKFKTWERIDEAEKRTLIEVIGKKRSEQEADNVIMQEAISRSDSPLSNLPLKLMEFAAPLIRKIQSKAIVAFAPISSFNYQEDLNAAKAPAQAFALAIELVRLKLAQSKSTRLIRFVNLPVHWAPSNVSDASRLRYLTGADALIWGSYLIDDPNKIWLNIHSRVLTPKDSKQDGREPTLKELFPYRIELNSVLVIDQRKLHNAYVVALLGLIHTINSRRDKDTQSIWSDKSGLLSKIRASFTLMDELYLGTSELDKLLELLVVGAFLDMPLDKNSLLQTNFYPSTETMLSDLAGEWVGREIRNYNSHSPERLADRLMPIIEKCISVNPKPEHYYRLGALQCMKRESERAVKAFERAKSLDRVNAEFWAYASAQANMALSEWSGSSSDAELAKYAAYCARTINLGDDYAKSRLKEEFEKSPNVEVTRLGETASSTFRLVERMLG
jgi:nicotinic acid mononucleotide adenylyltransferase